MPCVNTVPHVSSLRACPLPECSSLVRTQRAMDSYKCHHYARFAAGLQPVKFDVVYWLLFLFVVSMLFCSSWYYGRYAARRLPTCLSACLSARAKTDA